MFFCVRKSPLVREDFTLVTLPLKAQEYQSGINYEGGETRKEVHVYSYPCYKQPVTKTSLIECQVID